MWRRHLVGQGQKQVAPGGEAESQTRQPQPPNKDERVGRASPLRREPVIAMRQVESMGGQEPDEIKQRRDEERQAQAEQLHEEQVVGTIHPAVGASRSIEACRHARRQMRRGRDKHVAKDAHEHGKRGHRQGRRDRGTSRPTRRGGGHGLERRLHLGGRGVASRGIGREGAQHDLVETHVDLHAARRRFELPRRRQFAGEHLIQHDAERVEIRTMVDRGGVRALFRRHVGRRARRQPGRGKRDPGGMACRAALTFGGGESCDAEVRDFHASETIHENVLRLDVAMHHAAVVRVLQRIAKRRHDRQRLACGKATGGEKSAQIHPVHEFHEDEITTGGTASVFVERDDAGMVQLGERTRLLRETSGEARIGIEPRTQDFQRDDTIEVALSGAIDRPHAALAEEIEDLERGKLGREFGRRGRRWRRVCARTAGGLGCKAGRKQVRRRKPAQGVACGFVGREVGGTGFACGHTRY